MYDEGGNLTIPITVYEDSRVEIFIPDITGEGWTQWHIDQYRAERKYWINLYSFFKGKARCLKTDIGSAQSNCVDYARYKKQIVFVDIKSHTVKFGEVAAYFGERTQPLGAEREPSGTYAITALDPGLAKAINRISAIVEHQLNSYSGLGIREIGEEQSKIVARMITNSTHPDITSSSTKSTSTNGTSGTTNGEVYGVAARKAAEQGDANAQFNLGASYDLGQGVPQDFAQAAFWYRKAAEQGNPNAQINLGAMYDYGQGVPQDYTEALFWLDVAASCKLGSIKEEDAYTLLKDDAASHLTNAVRLQTQERARKWLETHNFTAKPC
ncbi:MAG: tetratricopeptide repeat protein [Terracidiphilus sp.]